MAAMEGLKRRSGAEACGVREHVNTGALVAATRAQRGGLLLVEGTEGEENQCEDWVMTRDVGSGPGPHAGQTVPKHSPHSQPALGRGEQEHEGEDHQTQQRHFPMVKAKSGMKTDLSVHSRPGTPVPPERLGARRRWAGPDLSGSLGQWRRFGGAAGRRGVPSWTAVLTGVVVSDAIREGCGRCPYDGAFLTYGKSLEKESVDAVSRWGHSSDYQRVRVEHVCSRLHLQPLAYLWRREQAALLREMISSGLHALLIKVAAFGLDPGRHLGKPLAEMEPYLQELSEKYGVHICGEGGEYETFTTDCPLFNKKIVIDAMETIIHSADAFAPVGYLRFTKMHTEDKGSHSAAGPAPPVLPGPSCPCLDTTEELSKEALCDDGACDDQEELPSVCDLPCERARSETESQPSSSGRSHTGYEWITGISGVSSERADVQGQTQRALTLLQGELQKRGLQLKHIVLVHIYVRNMEDFSGVNSVYGSFFSHSPPARVCVQTRLPAGHLLQLDALLHDWVLPPEEGCFQQRNTLHVQSLSHWVPASIGPYSQAVRVDEAVFCAGQIALVPCTMTLLDAGAERQARMCYRHADRVLGAVGPGLTLGHALQAHCYVTHRTHIPSVRRAWCHRALDQHHQVPCCGGEEVLVTPLEVVVVPSLPRGAAVELHVVAVCDEPTRRTSIQQTSEVLGCALRWQVRQDSSGRYASLSLSVSTACSGHALGPAHTEAVLQGPAHTEALLQALGTSIQQALEHMEKDLSPLCARIFYQDSSHLATGLCAGLEACLDTVLGMKRPALVQVPVLELPDCCFIHISCWLSV
ncbi:uncharacterized protein LOC143481161 [Brachyhypopomus gauderio]|uniref:uncharacterized protein LOC143481161 n=1 Tax=Brachyhypopomus gauderio TaxID=698409 RepID=UPI004042E31C